MRLNLLLMSVALTVLVTGCSSDEPENPALPEEELSAGPVEEGNEQVPDVWETTDQLDLTATEEEIVGNLNAFNDRLIDAAAAASDGDYSISPLSVSIYLGMLANSCDGDARSQIVSALGCNDLDELNALSEKLMHYLPSPNTGMQMNIANRVWVADRYTAPADYADVMARVFNAEVKNVNFGASQTFADINAWVSDNTHGLIPYIIPETDWQQYASMPTVSANTVYFLGQWMFKFDKSLTDKAVFSTPAGNVEVDMMHSYLQEFYAKSDNGERVIIPFSGQNYQLEIYLPAEGKTPADLTADVRDDIDSHHFRKTIVDLSLPRFTSRSKIDNLASLLALMGMTNVSQVSLSPMGINETVPVQFVHKTSMKVDEDGAELAAVTGGLYGDGPEEPDHVTMTVNRPFMYVVRHYRTRAIVLAGTVSDPRH